MVPFGRSLVRSRDGHECWWIQDRFTHTLTLARFRLLQLHSSTVANLSFCLGKVVSSICRALIVLSCLANIPVTSLSPPSDLHRTRLLRPRRRGFLADLALVNTFLRYFLVHHYQTAFSSEFLPYYLK